MKRYIVDIKVSLKSKNNKKVFKGSMTNFNTNNLKDVKDWLDLVK